MDLHNYLIDHAALDWPKLLSHWQWLLPVGVKVEPWLMNRFGDLFWIDSREAVHWLNITDGSLEPMTASEGEFLELLEDQDNLADWMLVSLVDEAAKKGKPLASGRCFGFKQLPIQGGTYERTNIKAFPIDDYWKLCGEIHRQLNISPNTT